MIRCDRCYRPGKHALAFGSLRLPVALCCIHMDATMVEFGRTVPTEEGVVGLARFRADHARQCGYEPPICAFCDRPESLTKFGTFTEWRGEKVHRGCLLDHDSDMADTYVSLVS